MEWDVIELVEGLRPKADTTCSKADFSMAALRFERLCPVLRKVLCSGGAVIA